MKGLSSKLIAELNKHHDGGIYFEGLAVTLDMKADPQPKDYLCNYQTPIEYGGNIYKPESMSFDGAFSQSVTMELQISQIKLYNIGGTVDAYIHKRGLKIRRNDILLQILHRDNNGVVSEYESERLQIQVVHCAAGKMTATIFAGLNMRLDDRVPRGTMEISEYPGIKADVIRAGT